MKTSLLMLALAGISFAVPAYSQDQDDERRPDAPRGRGGFSRVEPVMAVLDTNQDNEISADEIASAADALKGLDRDKNGKLTPDELRRDVGGRRGFAGDGPGPAGFGQRRGPDRGAGGPRGFGGGFRGGPQRGEQERGGPQPGEQERGGPDRGPRGPGFGGFGPLSPEQFVARAMEFDADKDGELDKAELTALAERLGPGFGGRGGFGSRGDGARNPLNRRGGPRQRPDNDRE
jgi:hypothetical protein